MAHRHRSDITPRSISAGVRVARPLSFPTTALLATLAALLLTFAFDVTAQESPRSINVQGEAERRVAPDMATLRLEVRIDAREPADARREAAVRTQRALETLRGAGLADADIDSTALSINPQYRWLKNEQRQELTGYRVSRTITARLLALEQLGTLLEALSDAGINRVQPPQLGVLDDESIRRELMAEAALNARERASAIATALGESLGEVLYVSTQGTPYPMPARQERMMMADTAAGSAAESYNAGHIDYRMDVSAAFALE